MGRSGSSFKRKYAKKKSLKVSSEARRKKRSKRSKSKKLHRHDDSYSSYSDDDSTTSSSLSSSSSEDEYKTRKSRSRTRNEVKGSKKRTRRRSCSEDSTNEVKKKKKRKRSKKKVDYEKKKHKKKIKKKPRRDDYSSDSASCSTCGDEDSTSDKDKGKNGNRKIRSRPRRSSSPTNSYYHDDDDDYIENVTVENNPRRLKSVITIATQPENEEGDDNDMKRDELKEEIAYDYDYDYPSCKSNDSNDNNHDDISVISKEKDNDNASDNNLESGADDLESILRKKALENLSRFRGGIQTKTLVPVDNNKQEHNQTQSEVKKSTLDLVQTPVIQRSRFTWRRDEIEKTAAATATYSAPDSSRSLPKLQSGDVSSSIDKVENKIITNETSENTNNEVKKSTVALETTKEGSSKEKQTETNDNSQFEKKTMSVMRGGEMVQVSYKVYIPNRAPALARRQLKR